MKISRTNAVAAIAMLMGTSMTACAIDNNRIAVIKTGKTVQVRSCFSDKYDVLLKIAPGSSGQINFTEVSLPASDAARYPEQGMLYYHKTTDDTPPWMINGHYIGGNHGNVVIKKQEYLVEGNTSLQDDMLTRCGSLEIVDEYDVTLPVKGKSEVMISNRIIYCLQPYGACTIEHHAIVRRACRINLWALTQAMVLSGGDFSGHDHYLPPAFERHDYYIPKTRPFMKGGRQYDFSRMEDYRKAALPIKFDATMARDTDSLPDRFLQLLGDKTRYRIGFACGYSPLVGLTRPEERARRCRYPVELSAAKKTSPHVLDDMEAAPGTELHGLAYRQYFNPAAFTNATAVYWHRQGKAHVVYIDYHRPVEGDVVRLPENLVGRTITVVEKAPGLKLLSGLQVPEGGMEISVTGDCGYVVMKLDE